MTNIDIDAKRQTVTPVRETPKRYYDVQKNWRKVKRHVDHPELQAVLVVDMDKFRWGAFGKRFLPGMTPSDTDPGDWIDENRRGRRPAFWKYVRHGACYWLVNFNLLLAKRVEPGRAWRIIESDKHATVWDGEDTLFDMNYLAFGEPPDSCFEDAYDLGHQPGQLRTAGPPGFREP